MPKTIAVVKLPEILGNGSSHLVKLAGKIDSFSLLLRETPEGELKRSIEVQFHSMVFATRKEIRKYCPRYRSLPGKGSWTSVRIAPPANSSRAISARPRRPSGAGSARRAASSQVFPRSKFLKRRYARRRKTSCLWPEPDPSILCIPAVVFTDKTHTLSQIRSSIVQPFHRTCRRAA